MEVTASTSQSRVSPNKTEILKTDEISAAIEEQLTYERDSSDASWMDNFE
jgi:hypothetical protein